MDITKCCIYFFWEVSERIITFFTLNYPHVIGQGYNILSEYFQDEGYFTFQACGDWRKSPSYGYVKGFDRTIYQSATMGSLCNDIIFSFWRM